MKVWFDMGTYKYFFIPSSSRRRVGTHDRLIDGGKLKSTAVMVGNMGVVVTRRMGAKSRVIDEYEIAGSIVMQLPSPLNPKKFSLIGINGITYHFDYMTARIKKHKAQTGVAGALGVNLKPSWNFKDESFSHMITGPTWGDLKIGQRILKSK
jgi:hypothetical protein